MKNLLALLVTLPFAPLPALDAAAPPPTVKPNIVFIYADDWGWGDLSCHGHPWLQTPNLDRLAREGMDFQQFNVLNPVCSPSRTAVMTGNYPARFSVHQHFANPAQNHARNMPDWLDPKAPTLPRFLKQAGYRTAHFGKWHLTNRDTRGAPEPEAYGYDEAAVFNGGAEWPSADLHATAANTVSFIKANKNKPFFINVWIHESHTPHAPTPGSMERWKHLDEQKQVYSAVITDGDNAVGTILAVLKEEGLEDNTIVMFSSDNGPEWTARNPGPKKLDADAQVTGYDTYYSVGQTGGLRGRKRSLFEGGVRTPFIVRWPGHTPAGVKNTATVLTAVDLLPTLCAAAGVELPADYHGDGENLLAALQGSAVPRTRPVFWEWLGTKTDPDYWPRLAVRDGDWKLALTDDAKRVELHRLTDDRAEAADVAGDHPEVVARLTKLALDWKATLPTKPNPECLTTAPDSGKTSQRKTAPKGATPDARAKAFARWETNHDGFLTLEEYQAGLKGQENLAARFKNFDKNGDGRLTRDEFVGGSVKPNIIFLLADDLGYMDVGCYNPKTFYETPNIDSLAQRGMKFTQAYAACCVCSPTRGSIMTGKYPPRFGITNFIPGGRKGRLLPAPNADHLPLEETTIAESLREAGYATLFAGKWHLGGGEFSPSAQGFAGDLQGGPQFFYPQSDLPVPDHGDDPKTTDRIANEAVKFIGEHKDKPFFAYLPFLAVHVPIRARPELVAKYQTKAAGASPDAWGEEGTHKLRLVQNQPKYAAMLEQLDAGIGRVLAALRENGIEDRTIIVFMSDNGGLSTAEGWPTSNLPLRGGKGWPYEGGVREPMILVAPGVTQPASTCDAPVISTDFYPTLLQLAGLPFKPGQHLDGVSLVPCLKGEAAERGKPLFWHYPHYSNQGGAPYGAIRDGDWKLIEWYEDGALELYNIRQDIGEKNNLAARQPKETKALHEKLIAWRKEVGALMPTPNTEPATPKKRKAK